MKIPSLSATLFNRLSMEIAMRLLSLPLAVVVLLAAPPTAHAFQIRIAERPALGPFDTLQGAVDAALEGESLIVHPRLYAPFTVDGKSVNVIVTGGEATISGKVVVKNLSSSQSVVLTRLNVTGVLIANVPHKALEVSQIQGHLRVVDSTFQGAGSSLYGGAPGAQVISSLNVVFSGCTLAGGSGWVLPGGSPADGAAGLWASNSVLALYGCTLRGGNGSEDSVPRGGHGGAGCSAHGQSVFASGCTFQGGSGGAGDYIGCNVGGIGGDGLQLDAAWGRLLGGSFTPGSGGWSSCGPPSPAGQPISVLNGGIEDHLPSSPSQLTAAQIVPDDAPAALTVQGQPGDQVYLLAGHQPSFAYAQALNGVWMVPVPTFTSGRPAGTLPASGILQLACPVQIPNGTVAARVTWLQALHRSPGGTLTLSPPIQPLVIDAASLPDCNGNSRHDFLDVLVGGAADCNHDLVPDSCEPDCDGSGVPDACEIAAGLLADCDANGLPDVCELAAGAPDCNANGILDVCDIASHSSPDVNANGIPDECEAQFSTWYIDDSAAPGGNGSAAAPFQSLAQALIVAFYGDTLLLADGLYQGPENRGIDLGGRHLTIRGSGGAANCAIDCGQQGPAFIARYEALTLEGLTIVRGSGFGGRGGAIYAEGSDVVVRACVLAGNTASQQGGAIYASLGSLRLEDSEFRDNSTWYGGGAAVVDRSSLSAKHCVFARNWGVHGGALWVLQYTTQAIEISHSTFLGNGAMIQGGAICDWGGLSYAAEPRTIAQSLFAGNRVSDDSGGALHIAGVYALRGNTLVDNSALKGGAAYIWASTVDLSDNILWNNSAPYGSQIYAQGSLNVSYCTVQGGQAQVSLVGGQLTWGNGNLTTDPSFQDPDGPDNDPSTIFDNDYRLSSASPCIDAGGNGVIGRDVLDIDGDGNVKEQVPLDLELGARRIDVIGVPDTGAGVAPIVDIGAYERPGP